jgi:hypothetical protein
MGPSRDVRIGRLVSETDIPGHAFPKCLDLLRFHQHAIAPWYFDWMS